MVMDDPRTTPREDIGPVDDPGGGRGLTRRLAVALPIAALCGLVIGIPVAILVGEWRVAVMVALGAAAITGTILAAIEDGRVQRRVDRSRPPDDGGRPPA